jgi:hypothetical protein
MTRYLPLLAFLSLSLLIVFWLRPEGWDWIWVCTWLLPGDSLLLGFC